MYRVQEFHKTLNVLKKLYIPKSQSVPECPQYRILRVLRRNERLHLVLHITHLQMRTHDRGVQSATQPGLIARLRLAARLQLHILSSASDFTTRLLHVIPVKS